MTRTLAERLWAKVDRQPGAGCWLWQGAVKDTGYGVLQRGARGEGLVRAHVAAWEVTHGPVPAGLDVCHSCDVRTCCRPDHLFVGSRLVNMRDAKHKDRVAHGERRPQAKLTAAQVVAIREAVRTGPRGTAARLAREHGVAASVIAEIKRGRTWVRAI